MESMDPKWKEAASNRQHKYKKYLEKVPKKAALPLLNELHDAAFKKIDCLDCAACCKNYSPRFKPPDIKRISKFLGMKESAFMDAYLLRDDEGDFVVVSKPCPFLNQDNTCSIYEVRPTDCARFPYTDEAVFLEKKKITLKNSTFCPAAFTVIEALMLRIP